MVLFDTLAIEHFIIVPMDTKCMDQLFEIAFELPNGRCPFHIAEVIPSAFYKKICIFSLEKKN